MALHTSSEILVKTKKLSSILWASLVCSVAFSLCQPSYAADAKMGADRHIAKGLNCQTCHGSDMKNPQFPEEATCVQCHNKEALAEKTKDLPGANPHKAPHNGDCINCNLQHEPADDYCAQCHKFNFKVK